MADSRMVRIESVENGWIVTEVTFYDDVDEDEEPREWSREREQHQRGQRCDVDHSPERLHVFTDHAKMMAFVTERTKPKQKPKAAE